VIPLLCGGCLWQAVEAATAAVVDFVPGTQPRQHLLATLAEHDRDACEVVLGAQLAALQSVVRAEGGIGSELRARAYARVR
jgi:hypothetical protein